MSQSEIELSAYLSGWVLVDGSLTGEPDDLVAYLVVESDSGEQLKVALPVTLTGRVREVFYWPFVPSRCYLQPGFEGGKPSSCDLTVSRLNPLKARLVMLRRLFSYFLRLTKQERLRAGLLLPRMLMDMAGCYQSLGRLRAFGPSPDYQEWIVSCERVSPEGHSRLLKSVRAFAPRFVVWIDTCGMTASDGDVRLSQKSATDQLGVSPELHVGDALDEPLHDSNCWIVRIEPGVRLAPWALFWFALAIKHQPACRVWYGDNDVINDKGVRSSPRFKPDWSPELAMASAYVGRTFALHADVLRNVAGKWNVTGAYELLLAAAWHCANRVGHVPVILSHESEQHVLLKPFPEVLKLFLSRIGVAAQVSSDSRSYLRVRYPVPSPAPLVSIVVPTRDRLDLLAPCITSVLDKTSWPHYQILIIDNQSSCDKTLAFMRHVASDERVKVLKYDRPFNYSAINNFAVANACGDVICLLNNDTEVVSPDWLDEMVSRLYQDNVGVVGARLLFENGCVQHAGDVLGPGGCAAHLHGAIEGEDPGYMDRAMLPQELSAVTAACMVTHKHLYKQLGGLDEKHLPVAFNDVDYCLRVREAGYRVLYTPYAELYHFESVSRGKDESPEKIARAKGEAEYMRKRWAHIIERDPFYNLNLNYSQPDFQLGRMPRMSLDMDYSAVFNQQ